MLKIILIVLVFFLMIGCRNQKPSSASIEEPPEIVGKLPLGNVNPDEARVKVEVLELTENGFKAKVIKQEEVGHSFQAILAPGQKIQLSTQNQDISKGDVLICIVEKTGEDTFKLMNYK